MSGATAPDRPASAAHAAIAIVGMAGAMPGSHDLAAYWSHLLAGDDLVTEVPPERWDWRDFDGDPLGPANVTASRWGGFAPLVDGFDAAFFGIAPREAASMDPQQRLMLTAAWEAIENAGVAPATLAGRRVGVFVGASGSDWKGAIEQPDRPREPHQASGTHQTMLANRISYFLDLRGPSETLDTACSSSLVALHRAVTALRSGEAELCLAGAVNLLLNPEMTIQYAKAGMLSPDGRCQTFDAGANGYVRSEGWGCVLLKPLAQALADGDTVHAVIRGSAVNHGGRANSLTAPNPRAQTALVADAVANAGVAVDSIGYVEAHGTGTALGDPIEINALKAAWRQLGAGPEARCALGAVKSNVGHLEAAAGMAGLFKLVFAMQARRLPGNLHHRSTNPHIDLAGSPFELVTAGRAWTPPEDADGMPLPLRAGISSFGFGGVNAHLVLEQAPPAVAATPDGDPALVLLSAPDAERLRDAAQALLDWLAPGRGGRAATAARLLDQLRAAQAQRAGCAPAALDPARDFGALGISPAGMARLVAQVAEATGTALRLADLGPARNLDEAAQALAARVLAQPALPGDGGMLTRRLPDPAGLGTQAALHDIAYTLQTGRQLFDERLAIVASSREELIAALDAHVGARTADGAGWSAAGNPRRKPADAATGASAADPGSAAATLRELAQRWLAERRLRIDWNALHAGRTRRRLPLPGTPLRLVMLARPVGDGHLRRPPAPRSADCALLGTNVSGLDGLGFARRLVAGAAPWLAGRPADAALQARRGLLLLDAALGAARRLGGAGSLTARDAVWAAPADLAPGACLRTTLAGARAATTVEIALDDGPVLFQAELTVEPGADSTPAAASLLPVDALAAAFAALGLGGALPFRLDGAWVAPDAHGDVRPQLQRRPGAAPCFDVQARDAAGRLVLRLDGLELRPAAGSAAPHAGPAATAVASAAPAAPVAPAALVAPTAANAEAPTALAHPVWIDAGPIADGTPAPAGSLLVFDADGRLARDLAASPGAPCVIARLPDAFEDWAALLGGFPADAPPRLVVDTAAFATGGSGSAPAPTATLAAACGLLDWLRNLARALAGQPAGAALDLLLVSRRDDPALAAALRGFALGLADESGRLALRVLDADAPAGAALPAADLLAELARPAATAPRSATAQPDALRHRDGRRQHRIWRGSAVPASPPAPPLRPGAILLTGGLGGLGRQLALHLGARGHAIETCGRSPADPATLRALADAGIALRHHALDIADADAVAALLAELAARHGRVAGIVHGAGVLRDDRFARQASADARAVLHPKLAGALTLDRASAALDLDFFAVFGSVVGVRGNAGQTAYAFANGWLDGFAQARADAVAAGRRHGISLAIDWPWWADGGMPMSESQQAHFLDRHGLLPLPAARGLAAFDAALAAGHAQALVLHGPAAAPFASPSANRLDEEALS
ncbi:SDR family NAD(P)-dependent oxidoreductase [Derxia lacustris]|uniref:SDR family NAD(P)-dependent oxidoreductase n=1 Tax=Derxia lacustris TaxID=764842 RepID=UPI000A17672E|nr:SDR family NAD(P)-dependent oxidoreductase [Derxia lacustris]